MRSKVCCVAAIHGGIFTMTFPLSSALTPTKRTVREESTKTFICSGNDDNEDEDNDNDDAMEVLS